MPADNGRQRRQEVAAPIRGGGKSHMSSRQEMAAQQEVEAVPQEAMQQPADGANKRQARGGADKRQWHDKRASMDKARLAGGGQQ